MDFYLAALRKYLVFSGRSSRKEYFMFGLFSALFVVISLVALVVLSALLWSREAGGSSLLTTAITFFLVLGMFFGVFLPGLSVTVRRLHDTNRSAWWLLLILFPYIGPLILFGLCCALGSAGLNRYGMVETISNKKKNPIGGAPYLEPCVSDDEAPVDRK